MKLMGIDLFIEGKCKYRFTNLHGANTNADIELRVCLSVRCLLEGKCEYRLTNSHDANSNADVRVC